VRKLSQEKPALFLAFDLLEQGGKDFAGQPLSRRRLQLEKLAGRVFKGASMFRLSPASTDIADAERWLRSAGGGSDGVIAKRLNLPYQAGSREGMYKIKRYRSADCVVGGFRYGDKPQAGRNVAASLLLGLYGADGLLHHVGFSSAIKAREKLALTQKLEAIVVTKSFTGNAPGGPSRWSTKRSSEWQAVKPTFVVEVSYDHFTGGRFRHGTTILRWRPDKKACQCTMDQVKQKVARELMNAISPA
jgi:ATP-dependent DNA ligase